MDGFGKNELRNGEGEVGKGRKKNECEIWTRIKSNVLSRVDQSTMYMQIKLDSQRYFQPTIDTTSLQSLVSDACGTMRV